MLNIEHFNESISVANYTFGVISGLVIAAAVFIKLRKTEDRHMEQRFLLGVGYVGLGWGLHQTYWLVWRILLANGNTEIPTWMVQHAYIVTPFYALIGLGALKCISVVALPTGHVPPRYFAAAFFVWFVGFFVGVLVS